MEKTFFNFKRNQANKSILEWFLHENTEAFIPSFELSVDIHKYANKLFVHATRFEVWYNCTLIALLAVYRNEETKVLYIPYFCVSSRFAGKGIGKKLFHKLLEQAHGDQLINLEVRKNNNIAFQFYENLGFKIVDESCDKYLMMLQL